MSEPVNVLVLVPFGKRHMARLREAAGDDAVVTQSTGPHDDEKLLALLNEAEVVIGQPRPALLAQAPSVRWVQMTWAGTDLYTCADVPFPAGITLTNVAGFAYGHIISQYVVGQVLALAQNLPTYVRQQEREEWQDAGTVMSLEGAEVLVFGAGDIGAMTAKRLSGFNVRCTGVCRNTSTPRPDFEHLVTLDEAEALLPSSDVVICCIPNTADTAGYLNERRLRLMKEGSILVNVGRGNFIDCDALARVLAEKRLRGAALDVTNPEPLPAGHPLWKEPRAVITPHCAGKSFGGCEGTVDRICDVICENLRRFLSGEPLTHVAI